MSTADEGSRPSEEMDVDNNSSSEAVVEEGEVVEEEVNEKEQIDFGNDNARDSSEIEIEHFEETSMEATNNADNSNNENSSNDPLLNSSSSDKDINKNGDLSNHETEKLDDDNDDKCVKEEGKEEINPLDPTSNENSNLSEGKKSMSDVNATEANDEKQNESDIIKASLTSTEVIEDEDEDDDRPGIVSIRMDGIFEEEEDDDIVEIPADDSNAEDPPDIQSMLQMSFREEEDNQSNNGENVNDEDMGARGRPRRAAAAAAASSIRVITQDESNGGVVTRRGRSSKDDDEYQVNQSSGLSNAHKCYMCKKWDVCEIKVQRFGTEVFFCSNACFNRQKGQRNAVGRLPCGKCGLPNLHLDSDVTYYWETMNFCSDLCVGNYQVEVGGKCSSCPNTVPWLSLGKYCVRFGSDIRQFCSTPCLENYKKNARVCFYCQLDIKRLGNVILANLPTKQTAKEFCTQECVEMYVEQNLNQTVKAKSGKSYTCVICSNNAPCFEELVLPKNTNLKACSPTCWKKLLETQGVVNPVKCETCIKFISMDFNGEIPSHFVSTNEKVFGFCSATCKNVFVLKQRQILACVTCKVKKYNYDLVQLFQGQRFTYAVCSLNCLPNSTSYIQNLKTTILSNSPLHSQISIAPQQHSETEMSFPVISSVHSMQDVGNNSGFAGITGQIVVDSYGNLIGVTSANNSIDTNSQYCSSTDPSQYDMSQESQEYVGNGMTENLGINGIIDGVDDGTWDGILKYSDIEYLLSQWQVSDVRTMGTMCKPKVSTVSTQTDESALEDMERIPLKTVEKIQHVPFAMPVPVYIPSPVYFMEKPVPRPMAVPIPVPILIPVIFEKEKKSSIENAEKVHVVSVHDNDVEMVELESESSTQAQSVQINNQTKPSSNTSEEVDPKPDNNDYSQCCASPTPSSTHNLTTLEHSPAPSCQESITSLTFQSPKKKNTKVDYALRAWKKSFPLIAEPSSLPTNELAPKLVDWVGTGMKTTGEKYSPDIVLYLCLGIQQHLKESGKSDNIFYDEAYRCFVEELTKYIGKDGAQGISTRRIEVHQFWESSQLGDSSPNVLLFTIIYLIYKHFNLEIWEKHLELQFEQVKIENQLNLATGKNCNFLKIVDCSDCEGIEIAESPSPDDTVESKSCIVKLVTLYKSKCEQCTGPFYKSSKFTTETSPEGPWYSSEPLAWQQIYQMLLRATMIKADSD